MPFISLKNLSCGFSGTLCFEEFTTHLSHGARIALIGSNGSGKSTLLKIIAGHIQPLSGSIEIPDALLLQYVQQSAYQNHTTESGGERAQHVAQIEADLHHLTLQQKHNFLFRSLAQVNKRVDQLSGGERMRLCLAKLAADTPPLLLLDEITNALDLETREHVIDVLKVYPGAFIVISHDMHFLQAISCSHKLVCRQGCLTQESF